jgi:hypothetical protein
MNAQMSEIPSSFSYYSYPANFGFGTHFTDSAMNTEYLSFFGSPPLMDEPLFDLPETPITQMQKFEKVDDWKHVLYNLLVDGYNNPKDRIVYEVESGGEVIGFAFDSSKEPEKRIAELYALHLRGASLETEDQSCVFVQDLYKVYLRSAYQLMAKYFTRDSTNKYTYLYDTVPLFVKGDSLETAAERLKKVETRQRIKSRGQRN